MDFSVSSFANRLFDYLLESRQFPYMHDEALDRAKHSKRTPLHLKQAIREQRTIIGSDTQMTFDIGSETLELNHPYYHILQDSYAIRKRNKGTKKTKGSQDSVQDKAKRDYGKVSWNGKTFTKEYDRNVRGMRKPKNMTIFGENFIMNRDADSYQNIHYKYIDRILDQEVVDRLALEFGLKKGRKVDSGLGEEYGLQEESGYTTNIFDILNTHDIGE